MYSCTPYPLRPTPSISPTPFLIGVCGNSGSGKSLLVDNIVKILEKNQTLVIHGDDYHKWPRGAAEWNQFTHLNPRANNLSLAATHLTDLKNGLSVHAVKYCHHTGKFIGPFHLQPEKYIIFEGLHSLHHKDLRKIMDFKIYLDVNPRLNNHFKIHRDMRERGYSKEKILEAIAKRNIDVQKYISPQKKYADLLIQKHPLIPLKDQQKDTAVKFTFIHFNRINLRPLQEILQQLFPKKIEIDLNPDRPKLKIKSILSEKELLTLANVSREKFAIDLNQTVFGLCQLITVYNLNFYGQKIGRLSYSH